MCLLVLGRYGYYFNRRGHKEVSLYAANRQHEIPSTWENVNMKKNNKFQVYHCNFLHYGKTTPSHDLHILKHYLKTEILSVKSKCYKIVVALPKTLTSHRYGFTTVYTWKAWKVKGKNYSVVNTGIWIQMEETVRIST